MRWTLILPALLAMACSAEANDRVVQARIFDQTTPSCADKACTGSGCATPAQATCATPAQATCATPVTASCATAGCTAGCAGACGQASAACGCGTCEQSAACSTYDGGCDTCVTCDDKGCRSGKCKGGKGGKGCKGCKDGKCKGNNLDGTGNCNVCNMPQHHRYPAVDHGYYYFRPYNYRHIAVHQDAVTRWGGDPRNPYSNEIFKAVYAEEASEKWEDVPVQMPTTPTAPATAPMAEPPVPTPTVDETANSSPTNRLRFISSTRVK